MKKWKTFMLMGMLVLSLSMLSACSSNDKNDNPSGMNGTGNDDGTGLIDDASDAVKDSVKDVEDGINDVINENGTDTAPEN